MLDEIIRMIPNQVFFEEEQPQEIQGGELFRDNNTNHILQFIPGEGLVHNEYFCKEITGCINFQQNN
jgi:hypothetical protein